MHRNSIFAAGFLLLGTACSAPQPFTEYETPRAVALQLTEHRIDHPLLHTDALFVQDSLLISLNTQNGQALFDLYSRATFAYRGSYGVIGRGPDEFDFVNVNASRQGFDGLTLAETDSYSRVDFVAAAGAVGTAGTAGAAGAAAARDTANAGRAAAKAAEDRMAAEAQETEGRKRAIRLRKSRTTPLPAACPAVNSLLVLSDTTAVLYCANDEQVEFYLHDRRDGSLRPFSHYLRTLLPDGISPEACSSVFLNDLVPAPARQRFAAVYSQLPMVRIFDSGGECLATSLLDSRREQRFTVKEGRVVTSASVQYYLAAAANDRYICALYLGERPERMRDIPMEEARMEIHVWNWEGEPVAAYRPDRLITQLTLDDEDILYAVSPLDENRIFTCRIGGDDGCSGN